MTDHDSKDLGDKAKDVAQDLRDKSNEAVGRVKQEWSHLKDEADNE